MTGATLEQEEQMRMETLWNDRRAAIQGFRTAVLNARKEETAHASQQALRREKRAELLLQCKKDIRAANRDSLFRETARCFRGLVMGDMELLRKEKQSIALRAGLPSELRDSSSGVIQMMMDALSTVTSAIDAGVYDSKEELQEAKRNLQEKYRAAVTDAILAIHLTRRDQWITLLLVNLRDNTGAAEPPDSVTAKINDAISCLEQKLEMIRAAIPGKRSETLTVTAQELQVCIGLITEAHSLYKEFEQQKNSSGSTVE